MVRMFETLVLELSGACKQISLP